MGKIAFMFPGQGAQYIGMAKDFYENENCSREVFEKASKATDLDIKSLCFDENDNINKTEYTQIAMLTAEVAILRAVEQIGIKADYTAGLSLGEYAAVVASGIMKEEDAFFAVRKRGIFMQEAVPVGGAMAAVLGLPSDKIEEICRQTEGNVSIANYNCPGQIVITGEESAVQQASEQLKEAGAKRVIPLNVSGPFHSKLLSPVENQLHEVLKGIELQYEKIPYVANLTGDFVFAKEEVKPLLEKQVSSPVKWQQSVERLIEEGVTTFIEIGPGKTLNGFMKKINKDVIAISIEHYEDLQKCQEVLSHA
ncbi:MAG: ACP S-malonyltransferase [Lachnospiraceae bacterium]|nr:ACP S-malonyltransferase [Lachnospiraceae bacterium]